MIATITVIAEKKVQQSQWSYVNHFSDFPTIVAITATTIAEIEKVLSHRSLWLRSLESGFHMIVMIAKRCHCTRAEQECCIMTH